MREFIPYLKKYKVYVFITPILMLLEVCADILLPMLMANIVDIGVVKGDLNYILKTGLIMVVLSLFALLFGILGVVFSSKAGYGFATDLRQETFERIQTFSFETFDEFTISSLVMRITNDINMIAQATIMSLRLGFRSPFMMIFALIMAFRMSPSLTIILIIALPLSCFIMYLVLKKARPLFLKLQISLDRLNGKIKENITGISVVKSFNQEEREIKSFKEHNEEIRDLATKAITTIVLLNPLLNLLIYGAIIVTLYFGGQEVINNTLSQGALISFITYITQVLLSLMVLSVFFIQLLKAIASKDRILEVWYKELNIINNSYSDKTMNNHTIEFKDVSFKYYQNGSYVLENINLSIKENETIGIIGSTGSSKTSLVQLISRLYEVSSGQLLIGGINVQDYDLNYLHDNIAFVLQQNTLFKGTLKENMLWANEEASDEEIIRSLKLACIDDFVLAHPKQLDLMVEEGGINFSGGQKQRLCIARALLKDSKILIFDDSTSAVDMNTDRKIQKTLKNELCDVTKIIIAQRISSIKDADRIIVMDKGHIETIGNHQTLLKTSSIYKEIYDSQESGRKEYHEKY